MTDEQIEMLRWLIKDEIAAAGIDGMEHGVWGYAERRLDEGWKKLADSFVVDCSTVGSDLLDAFHEIAIRGKDG